MASKEKISKKIFFSKIFRTFFFENYWKKLGKKNSKWLFWMTNGMFLKKKSWNFEKINFFKILRFWRNRNYRTFPTSTTPKGKIRFFRVHMMSHLRKISFEPSYVPWESNISVDPSDAHWCILMHTDAFWCKLMHFDAFLHMYQNACRMNCAEFLCTKLSKKGVFISF